MLLCHVDTDHHWKREKEKGIMNKRLQVLVPLLAPLLIYSSPEGAVSIMGTAGLLCHVACEHKVTLGGTQLMCAQCYKCSPMFLP